MILVVSSPDDAHVAAVVPGLRRRGVPVAWFDLAELPSQAQLSIEYGGGAAAQPTLALRGSRLDLRAVSAVWARRPRPPVPDRRLAGPALRDYARRELADAWLGTAALLDCLWLPAPPTVEQRAAYKPLQLQVATDLGFEVPPTLVTSRADELLDFHRRHGGRVITKTLHNRFLAPDPAGLPTAYALTEVVAGRDLVHAGAVRHCPVIVQPYVDKRVELRITVVGDRVFPVEIQSQWTHHTRHDWRRFDDHHERHAVHDLPRTLARRCASLVARLGLRYGAIDMILTPDGRYVFLEINPNGAWLAMARATGLPIAEAVGDLLRSRERRGGRVRVPPDVRPAAPPALPRAGALATASPRAVRLPSGMRRAVDATLRSLARWARAGTPPARALADVRRLGRRHRGVEMDLVWDVESLLGTIHYDALLTVPGGVVSLALSPDRGVPWALRHAHHVRETDLLRVNGRTLNMQTVMGYLDDLWYDAGLVRSLVDGCLVREAVDARGIGAAPREVRRAQRAFRRAHDLGPARALRVWLRRRGWTPYDLEHEVRRQVIAGKLRAQITRGRVADYFARHRRDLDTTTLASVWLTDRAAARRLARRGRLGGVAFAQAAQDAIAAGDAAGVQTVTVRRRDLRAHAAAIFAAAPGAVLGPLAAPGGAHVVRVLRVVRARLDPPTRDLIAGILFEQWLEARRAAASVEWFWGDAERARPRPGRHPLAR